MGKHIELEMTDKEENMWGNLKGQFKRDFDSTNNVMYAKPATDTPI